MASYAREEALTILQTAQRHAERLSGEERDRRVLDLVIRQGKPLHDLGRNQDALDILLCQQERVEQLKEPWLSTNYYFHLGLIFNGLGKWEDALHSAQRCLEEASRCGSGSSPGLRALYAHAGDHNNS